MIKTLAKFDSMEKMAQHYGVSAAFLRVLVFDLRLVPVVLGADVEKALKRYQSVRLAARILEVSEGELRKRAKGMGLNLNQIVHYDLSQHNNAKGRRAELFFLEQRKLILERGFTRSSEGLKDMNVLESSQHEYDVLDPILRRVNVKSSVRVTRRAKTRQGRPYTWKFSTTGREGCDCMAWVGYDTEMQEPQFVLIVEKDYETGGKSTIQVEGDKKGGVFLDGRQLSHETIMWRKE